MRYGWTNSSGTPTANLNAFSRPVGATAESRKLSGIETQIGGNRTWEIELPNGQYNVRLTSGDPGSAWQIKLHSLVEGQEIVNFTPANGNFFATGSLNNVSVTDGRLTITNGPTAQNNRITHLEIVSTAAANSSTLAAPSNLSTFQSEGTQLDLRWRDNSNNEDPEVGFRIQRSSSPVGGWTTIGTAYANAELFTLTPSPGSFFYRVVAVKGSQESPPSNFVWFNPSFLPAGNSGLGATPQFGNENSLPYFAWQAEDYNRGGQQQAYSDTTAGNAGGYWRSGNGDIGSLLNPLAPSELERTGFVGWTRSWEWQRYSFTGPAATSQYRFELRYATPDAGGRIMLSHKPANDQWFADKTGQVTLPATGSFRNFANITSDPFSINALPTGESQFMLQNYANTVSGRWNANLDWFRVVPANTPTELAAQAVSNSQINLTWRDNATNESGYVVERATNLNFTQGLTTFNVGPNTTTFSSTGLAANTLYFYRVRAVVAGTNTPSTYWAHAKTLNHTQPVLPQVTITPATRSVMENIGTFDTTVTLSSPRPVETLVILRPVETDTAVMYADYYWTSSNLEDDIYAVATIPAGQTSATFSTTIVDNTLTEGNKVFTWRIQPSEFVCTIGNPSASVVTIVDDEGTPGSETRIVNGIPVTWIPVSNASGPVSQVVRRSNVPIDRQFNSIPLTSVSIVPAIGLDPVAFADVLSGSSFQSIDLQFTKPGPYTVRATYGGLSIAIRVLVNTAATAVVFGDAAPGDGEQDFALGKIKEYFGPAGGYDLVLFGTSPDQGDTTLRNSIRNWINGQPNSLAVSVSSIDDVTTAIRDRSNTLQRPIRVILHDHGRPGLQNVGNILIDGQLAPSLTSFLATRNWSNYAFWNERPALRDQYIAQQETNLDKFANAVGGKVEVLFMTGCETAGGVDGPVFYQRLANKLGAPVRGFTQPTYINTRGLNDAGEWEFGTKKDFQILRRDPQ